MFRKEYQNAGQQFGSDACRNHFKRKFDRLQQRLFQYDNRASSIHPVNIAENEEFYQVQLFAAGKRKDQFQVRIQNQVLTISCTASELEPGMKYIYQEQPASAFERAFQLQDQVLVENVHASYEDGVLTVILQKDPAMAKPEYQVAVS